MDKIIIELNCNELSDIYMSLQLALIHGAYVEETFEKITSIFERECKNKQSGD